MSPSLPREATLTRSKRTRPPSLTKASTMSPMPLLTCKSRPWPPPLSRLDSRRPRGHQRRRRSSPRHRSPPAAAIVPASTLVDIAETSAAAVRARDSTPQDTKMLDALESILHSLEALDSPSRSPHSPPSSPSDPSSCSSLSIAIEVPVIASSASRRRYKIENPPSSLKGCMERPEE
jgi:hypothetical protein